MAWQLLLLTGTLHFLVLDGAAVRLPRTQEDPRMRKEEDARGAGQCALKRICFRSH